MKKRTLFTALALLFAQSALADRVIVTEVEATELSPSNIILPGSVNGMVTFRPCADDCDAEYERARLTEATSFIVNGAAVKWEDFRVDFTTIRADEDSYALVSVDLRTNTVTRIEIQS